MTAKSQAWISNATTGGHRTQNLSTTRSSIMNVMAEFDNLIHGIVTGMNKILSSDGTPEGQMTTIFFFQGYRDKILTALTDGPRPT